MKRDVSNKYNGFSLIEILLVVTLFALISAMTIPFGIDFLSRDRVSITRDILVNSARTAQHNAINMRDDDDWGIEILQEEIVVYKGNDYATRDSAYDSVTSIPSGVAISGSQGVFYKKLDGEPSTTATFTISGASNSGSAVQIDQYGKVTY